MNVIIPFEQLDPEVQEKLRTKAVADSKSVSKVGAEVLTAALLAPMDDVISMETVPLAASSPSKGGGE